MDTKPITVLSRDRFYASSRLPGGNNIASDAIVTGDGKGDVLIMLSSDFKTGRTLNLQIDKESAKELQYRLSAILGDLEVCKMLLNRDVEK